MFDAARLQQRRGTINGVFFAETPEVKLHAGAGQRDFFAIPCDVLPAYERQYCIECCRVRQVRAFEIPGPSQNARRAVKQAIAQRKQLRRKIQQFCGLVIDFDGFVGVSCRCINLREKARLAIARILCFDTTNLSDCSVGQRLRVGYRQSSKPYFAGARHRRKFEGSSLDLGQGSSNARG